MHVTFGVVAMVAFLFTISVPSGEASCVHPYPTVTCGENEEYQHCGTACPLTCANMDTIQSCTKQCVVGCFCKEGYVRNDKNKCIRRCLCPKQYNY
uniref:TIL domain-containing protein n=1 Tax=Anopheles funestus TaxID=62324 RepID=A0A182RDI8_ANOFN